MKQPIQQPANCNDVVLDCTKKLDAVLEASESVKDVSHPNEILHTVIAAMGRDLGYAFPMVFLLNEEKNLLVLKKMGIHSGVLLPKKGLPTNITDIEVSMKSTGHALVRAAEEESAVITRKTGEFSDLFAKTGLSGILKKEKGLRLAIAMPLLLKKNVYGVLAAFLPRGEFKTSDQLLLQTLANQISVAFYHAELFRRIEEQKETLHQANLRLRELDRTKSEFISIASHQLRTPLTVIKGYLSLILEGSVGSCDELAVSGLKKIAASTNRLVSLVNDLLDISRIERGVFLLEKKPLRLELVAESVADELLSLAERNKVNLRFHRPRRATPKVDADEQKIREVMLNMIENAVKYSPRGKVSVSVKAMPASIRFTVKDTGLGLSPDTIPKLFEKFSRGEGVSVIDTEGVGLGLFFAKRIIDEHGGRIWAESKGKNKGSTFSFDLPVSRKRRK